MTFKNTYTIPDLLTNESFLNFYFQRNEDDILDWEDWRDENPDNEQLIKQAFDLLDRLSLKWNETEIKQRFAELKHRLEPEAVLEEVDRPVLVASYWRRWVAAATVLIVVSLGIGLYLDNRVARQWIVENSDASKPAIHTLKDGSKVTLMGKSHLEIAQNFNETSRTVKLVGEAFFEVAHNPDKPFFVITDNIVTKVLGTSFFVKSPIEENGAGGKSDKNSKAIEIEVVTGKVSVFTKDKTSKTNESIENGVILTPNQKVTYWAEKKNFVVGLVAKPVLIEKVNKEPNVEQFRFDETPLSEALTKLEKAYGIQIVLSNDKMNECPITANLGKQPLFGKLDLLCAILKASYEVQGTQILITGRGCE